MAYRPPIPPYGDSIVSIPKRAFVPKKRNKYLPEEKRVEKLKELYEDSRRDYNENNTATALYQIFSEILEALPKDELNSNNTLSLFESALKDTRGYEDNTKTYI